MSWVLLYVATNFLAPIPLISLGIIDFPLQFPPKSKNFATRISRKSPNRLKPDLRPAKTGPPAKAGPRPAKAGPPSGQLPSQFPNRARAPAHRSASCSARQPRPPSSARTTSAHRPAGPPAHQATTARPRPPRPASSYRSTSAACSHAQDAARPHCSAPAARTKPLPCSCSLSACARAPARRPPSSLLALACSTHSKPPASTASSQHHRLCSQAAPRSSGPHPLPRARLPKLHRPPRPARSQRPPSRSPAPAQQLLRASH
jgi:hypothetical protein